MKYPYIPKEYYPAVMFACKMIRENGYYNKAIETAASYYGVDRDELDKHVRARQGAGQKGKQRKYNYYVIAGYTYYNADGTCSCWDYTDDDYLKHAIVGVFKATSEENAVFQAEKKYESFEYRTGFSGKRLSVNHIEKFDSLNDADERSNNISREEYLSWIKGDKT